MLVALLKGGAKVSEQEIIQGKLPELEERIELLSELQKIEAEEIETAVVTSLTRKLESQLQSRGNVMCPEKTGHGILLERGSKHEKATLQR